jgi:hypothetical protein
MTEKHRDNVGDFEDAGSYIGREPEPAADTIPGGVQHKDERVAGTATQSSGEGSLDKRAQEPGEPTGHREGAKASDDIRRGAGENE